MRDLPPEILALLTKRQGIIVHRLYLLSARNRGTGDIEQIGIWSGADHQDFTVDGQTHTFYGGGNFLTSSDLKSDRGLTIRKLSVEMAPFTAEIRTVLREYDPKFQPMFVYLAFFDPETNNMVANPWRVFKGWIDTAPERRGAKGDKSQAVINGVGHTRILTRTFPAKRSNETQKLRDPNDTFFSNVAITGTINTPWGTAK